MHVKERPATPPSRRVTAASSSKQPEIDIVGGGGAELRARPASVDIAGGGAEFASKANFTARAFTANDAQASRTQGAVSTGVIKV